MAGTTTVIITVDGSPILESVPDGPAGEPTTASAAFAALKTAIGARLTALMQERSMEEGEALDVLEEVISDDDLDAETAALAGGALPKTRSKPRPPGKARQAARGVKRNAPSN